MTSSSLNERYLGTCYDIRFIAEYLKRARSTSPKSKLPIPSCSLAELLTPLKAAAVHIDAGLLLAATRTAHDSFTRDVPSFQLLPHSNFYCGLVPAGDPDNGGFFSRYWRGFNYIGNYGFAAVLSPGLDYGTKMRTIELARSYIHDSLHAATYRTFRRRDLHDNHPVPVYREQYGFNFRRSTGISYSRKGYESELPGRLNLNILMDGLTTLAVARVLSTFAVDILRGTCSSHERSVMHDVTCLLGEISADSPSFSFHRNVTSHVVEFLDFWDAPELQRQLFRAMLTGEMAALCAYFLHLLAASELGKNSSCRPHGSNRVPSGA